MSGEYEAAQEIAAASSQNTDRLVAAIDRLTTEQSRLADALAVSAKATLATFEALAIAAQTLGNWVKLAEARMDALAVLVETVQERTAAGPRLVELHEVFAEDRERAVVVWMGAGTTIQPIVPGCYPYSEGGRAAINLPGGIRVMARESPAEVAALLRGDGTR